MNTKPYIYKHMIKPISKNIFRTTSTAAIIWIFISCIQHLIQYGFTSKAAVNILLSCIGGCLGCIYGYLTIMGLESIFVLRRIHRAFEFVKEFDTLEDACFSYQNIHDINETILIFGKNIYLNTIQKYKISFQPIDDTTL